MGSEMCIRDRTDFDTTPPTSRADTSQAYDTTEYRSDSRWARQSEARRGKVDVDPVNVGEFYLQHPWFDALLTKRKGSIKVGEALTSPASLHAPFSSTLSLDLDGSVVHRRPAAGEDLNAAMKEAMVQKICPLNHRFFHGCV